MTNLVIRLRWAAPLLLAAIIHPTIAQEQPDAGQAGAATALTIYSSAHPGAIPPELYRPMPGYANPPWQRIPGYAVVKQERGIEIGKKRDTVRFVDVAAWIDPTTVTFQSLTDPDGTRVLEQNYEFDLVSTAKLMERFLDKQITVEQIQGDKVAAFEGTLLSTSGGVVLRGQDGSIKVVNNYANVQFPELPGGLITRPTLVWHVATDKPGPHRSRVTYQTGGMTWWADYNVVFSEGKDANSGVLGLWAWVSIINQSGAGYPDAKLKLIAGDVHRAPTPQFGGVSRGVAARAAVAEDAGFEEKAFFEYHLYTLGRPTTLPNNSTKQIELFPAADNIPCEKVLVYYGLPEGFRWSFLPEPAVDRNFGTQMNKKVDIYLRFKNEKEVGLGMPLPAGRIRVSKQDPADKTLEFIGEDTIDHTPRDEQVLIKLGSAFDVVGERRQADFSIDVNGRVIEETIELKVRNHKDEPVKVLVKENLYRWSNWEITKKTHEFEKVDARTIHFPITIPKDGEETVRYTVRYTWSR